jgi:anti-anti-sigma factor
MHSHLALDGRVLVLKPAGHLVGGPETEAFVDVARQFAHTEHVALVVDLDELEYMNSLGLGSLARIVSTYARLHGQVKVCNVKGRVRRLFDVVKFYKIFEYYESESVALGALSKEMANPV